MLQDICMKEHIVSSGNSIWNCWQYFPSVLHCSQPIFDANKHSDTEDMSGALLVLPQLFKMYLFVITQICSIKWLILKLNSLK